MYLSAEPKKKNTLTTKTRDFYRKIYRCSEKDFLKSKCAPKYLDNTALAKPLLY